MDYQHWGINAIVVAITALAVCASLLGLLAVWILPEKATRENAVAESLSDSISEPFDTNKSTFGWRISMWQAYVFEFLAAPPAQKAFGLGLGNPAIYAVDNTESKAAAHNYFIFTLNRAGIFGLLALIAAYMAVLRRVSGPRGTWDYLSMLSTLTICQLVYFTVYSPSYDQGLLAGAAFGIVLRRPEHA